jgi:ATP-dependent helicase/nuclease subunit B
LHAKILRSITINPLNVPPEKVLNIPLGAPFMHALSLWILDQDFEISSAYIFVPNHLSAVALKKALSDLMPHSSSMLLPRIFTLGNLSSNLDLIPHVFKHQKPIKTQKNHTFISSLLKEWFTLHPENSHFSIISAFQDLLETSMKEEVDWHKLSLLIPDSLAKHRQVALGELEELIDLCKKIIEENGRPESFYERWFQDKLSTQITHMNRPIILAGTTASQPGTWRLMQAVAQNPQGHIVLSGFDSSFEFSQTAPPPYNHPQAILQRRVYELGIIPFEIPYSFKKTAHIGRAALATKLLGFQETNDLNSGKTRLDSGHSLTNFHIGVAKNEREEHSLTAALAKAALHNGAESIAIVTPIEKMESYALALSTVGIPVASRQAVPLMTTPAGRLVMDLLALVKNQNDVAIWLSILRNPHVLTASKLQRELDKFEQRVLRDFATFHNSSKWFHTSDSKILAKLIHSLNQWAHPLKNQKFTVSRWAKALLEILDALGADKDEAEINSDPFTITRDHIRNLISWSQNKSIPFDTFQKLLSYMLNTFSCEAAPITRQNQVFLLSPLDIRLLKFDTIILTNFNDGHWPKREKPTFWLSETQKQELGFASSDVTIGQSAHDFLRSFSCDHVIITRSTFDQGVPTDPSPWLLRLEASTPQETWESYHAYPKQILKSWHDYSQSLHSSREKQSPEPLQCGIIHKPKTISATRLERLIQNPFQFFVTQILKIQDFQPFGNIITPSRYGDIVHSIMDQFAKHPDRHLDVIEHIANQIFAHFNLNLVQASRILITIKSLYRKFMSEIFDSEFVLSEVEGSIEFVVGEHTVTLKAKADRIDVHPNQTAIIIDYKTGIIPTQKGIHNLESIQLLFEAFLMSQSGFSEAPEIHPRAIEYRQAKIGSSIIKSTVVSDAKLTDTLEKFQHLLQELLENYLNDSFDFPYVHQDRHGYNPLAHLARYGESE